MRGVIAGAAALALVSVSGAAEARDIPAGGFTTHDVVVWLSGAGYKAIIVTDNGGSSHVSSASDGVDFQVYLNDCKYGRCGSLQFAAGFATHGRFNTSRMNEWNRDSRWQRGYFDRVDDPWIEQDVDLTPGGTYELLNDELAIWNAGLDDFVKKYGLK